MIQGIDFNLLSRRHVELGASRTTIQPWRRGGRPQARFMPKIAETLNLSLVTVVEVLWREKIGDPCQCGCGGKKVFPEKFPTARKLVIEIPCAQCGLKRISKQGTRASHRKLCRKCAQSREWTDLAPL